MSITTTNDSAPYALKDLKSPMVRDSGHNLVGIRDLTLLLNVLTREYDIGGNTIIVGSEIYGEHVTELRKPFDSLDSIYWADKIVAAKWSALITPDEVKLGTNTQSDKATYRIRSFEHGFGYVQLENTPLWDTEDIGSLTRENYAIIVTPFFPFEILRGVSSFKREEPSQLFHPHPELDILGLTY